MTDSMRDDIDAALDAAGEADDTQDFEETPQEVLSDDEPQGTEADGESDAPANEPEGDAGANEASAGQPRGEESTDEKPDTRSLKAPVDWSPKEREDWSRIPRHLQDKIASREQAMQNTMEKASGDRRVASEFGKLATSYGPILKGIAGETPMAAVENLFSMAANLRMGTVQEKAQTIANLIGQFDIDINALDGALVGQEVQRSPEQTMQDMIDKQLAPIMGQYQQHQQNQNTQVRENARTEVQQFSQQAEFLEDVRVDMADMIDMASARGQKMPMNEAYAKACAMHPGIQQVLQQRAEQKRVTGGNSNMAGKRLAASSVIGHRGGNGGGSGPTSLRDSIADAWDSQSN
jgi:hypothetical protein